MLLHQYILSRFTVDQFFFLNPDELKDKKKLISKEKKLKELNDKKTYNV
jgi:hypothetical protein